VVVDRLSGRATCPKCQTTYHLREHPPNKPGVCDNDGTPLAVRPDDAPDRVRQRLQEYAKKTSLLTGYYKARGVVRNVDAVGTPEEVERRIVAALK
jgi:adenylate kinase